MGERSKRRITGVRWTVSRAALAALLLAVAAVGGASDREHARRVSRAAATFGRVLYVNMDRREDRRRAVARELRKSETLSQIGIERVAGYDGERAPLHQLVINGQLSPKAYVRTMHKDAGDGARMTHGGIGCLMSHMRAWKRVLEVGKPVLVFEDDVRLVPGFDYVLGLAAAELPEYWNMLYLSNLVHTEASREAEHDFTSNLYRLSGEYHGMYAYGLTPAAARYLLADAWPMLMQANGYVMETARFWALSVFRTKQNLVLTDSSRSRDSDVWAGTASDALVQIPRTLQVLEEELPPLHVVRDADQAAPRRSQRRRLLSAAPPVPGGLPSKHTSRLAVEHAVAGDAAAGDEAAGDAAAGDAAAGDAVAAIRRAAGKGAAVRKGAAMRRAAGKAAAAKAAAARKGTAARKAAAAEGAAKTTAVRKGASARKGTNSPPAPASA